MTKKFCVLSIFGGGIKSIIPALILTELEDRLKAKSTQNSRIVDYFDLVAGTSMGGLISALILSPIDKNNRPYPMANIYEFARQSLIQSSYFDPKIKKCIRAPDYSSKNFSLFMNDLFENLEVKDFLKPSLITAYEPNRNWLAYFKQQYAKLSPEHNFYVRDAVLATTAMPLYFNAAKIKSFSDHKVSIHSFIDMFEQIKDRENLLEFLKENNIISNDGSIIQPIRLSENNKITLPPQYRLYENTIYEIIERIKSPEMTFIDGAIFANNPSMSAFIEANRIANKIQSINEKQEVLFISLGTGLAQAQTPYSDMIDQHFMSQLLRLLFLCSEKLSHFQTYHAFNMLKQTENYYHFNPILNKSVSPKINDTRESNLLALEKITKNYIQQISDQLDQLVDKLLES